MDTKRLFAASAGTCLLFVCLAASALKLPPPPPTKAELAGVWLGPDEASSILQLKLDRLGRGQLIVREQNPSSTSVYKITLVKIDGHNLSFAISNVSGPNDIRSLSGTSLAYAIRLVRHYTFLGQDVGLPGLLVRKQSMQSGVKAIESASAQLHSQPKR